jgi:hypothetical protein
LRRAGTVAFDQRPLILTIAAASWMAGSNPGMTKNDRFDRGFVIGLPIAYTNARRH